MLGRHVALADKFITYYLLLCVAGCKEGKAGGSCSPNGARSVPDSTSSGNTHISL